jgi:protein-S-isoprenylcysteine O-methyltransferase Ste14
METSRQTEQRRRWSDWFGFLFFFLYAIWLFRRGHDFVLLLLPTILHEFLVSLSFLLRRKRRASDGRLKARLVAYGASFVVPVMLGYAQATNAWWMTLTPSLAPRVAGLCLWIVGTVLSVWGVWHLRYAFGIEPQARDLVRTGLYRFARHPIYASYLLQYAGICLLRINLPMTLTVLAWFSLVLVRISYEEKVLQAVFPEYASYRAEVGMFCPRLPRQSPERVVSDAAVLAPALEPWRSEISVGGMK